MTILYDLRTDSDNALVIEANKNLRDYYPELLNEFGAISSVEWWKNFDSGRISTKITTGKIISICPDENDDLGDAVTILTSEGEIAYDYESYWLNPAVKIGATVQITSIKSTVSTKNGPNSFLIDVKIEVINC